MLDDQLAQVQENESNRLQFYQMPAIPDTLYMLDEPSRLAAVQCASVPSQQQQTSPGGSAVDIIAGTIPGKEFSVLFCNGIFPL